MRPLDFIRYSGFAITSNRMRSFLTGLGITIGIAAVVLLTSIGEGVQRFIVAEFTQFGTNLIAIVPGQDLHPRLFRGGDQQRPAPEHRRRAVPDPVVGRSGRGCRGPGQCGGGVRAPAAAHHHPRHRSAAPRVWQFKVAIGRFLPADDPRRARAFVVLGSKVRRELYGDASPLGRTVRIGGSRFRVIGVMESKGQILGFDLDDAVYIPTAKALELFNRESVMEIDVLYGASFTSGEVAARIKKRLIARHGSEDFTINTQDQMLSILGSVLDKLTLAVGALGGISLLVGGVGILTIMTIAVHDRTGEIGLLRALGATRGQILFLFLWEAVFLSLAGGLTGLLLGWGGAKALHFLLPALPTHTPLNYALYAEILAVTIGLGAGVLPARRAAGLDPVEALRTE